MQMGLKLCSDIVPECQHSEKIIDKAVNCPLCGMHLDSQVMGFSNCPVIKANIIIRGQYEDIYKQTIPCELVKTLENIDKFREENC